MTTSSPETIIAKNFDRAVILANVRIIGGVSNYAIRLSHRLESNGITTTICNIGNLWAFLCCLVQSIFTRGSVYYVQTQNVFSILAIGVFGLSAKTVIFDHNSSRHFHGENFAVRRIRSFVYKRALAILVVSARLAENYSPFGISKSKIRPFEVLYTPSETVETVIDTYPQGIRSLLLSDRKLITTSAYRYAFDSEGRDIYQIEKLGLLFGELAAEYPNVNFLIAIAKPPALDDRLTQYPKLRELSEKFQNFYLVTNSQLWPLLQKTTLFLRITTTDGDSISVREALSFGSAVLASNVVERPNGVILVDYDDIASIRREIIRHIGKALPPRAYQA